MSSFDKMRDEILAETIACAKERGGGLGSPSAIKDDVWKDMTDHVYAKGPLPEDQMISFFLKHQELGGKHWMDLFFEVSRLYGCINALVERTGYGQEANPLSKDETTQR